MLYLLNVYTPTLEGEEWVDDNVDIPCGWYSDKRMFDFLCDGHYKDEFINKVEESGLDITIIVADE